VKFTLLFLVFIALAMAAQCPSNNDSVANCDTCITGDDFQPVCTSCKSGYWGQNCVEECSAIDAVSSEDECVGCFDAVWDGEICMLQNASMAARLALLLPIAVLVMKANI